MNFVLGFLVGLATMAIISYCLNEFNPPKHRASRRRPAFGGAIPTAVDDEPITDVIVLDNYGRDWEEDQFYVDTEPYGRHSLRPHVREGGDSQGGETRRVQPNG